MTKKNGINVTRHQQKFLPLCVMTVLSSFMRKIWPLNREKDKKEEEGKNGPKIIVGKK